MLSETILMHIFSHMNTDLYEKGGNIMKVTIRSVLRMLIGVERIVIKDCIEFEYKTFDECIDLLGDIADEEVLSIEITSTVSVTLTLRKPATLIF